MHELVSTTPVCPYRHRRSPQVDECGRWNAHHNPYHHEAGVGLPAQGMARGAGGHAASERRPFTAFRLRPRPQRDRTLGSSNRKYRFSAQGQNMVDAESSLVVASRCRLPGTTADAPDRQVSRLAEHSHNNAHERLCSKLLRANSYARRAYRRTPGSASSTFRYRRLSTWNPTSLRRSTI